MLRDAAFGEDCPALRRQVLGRERVSNVYPEGNDPALRVRRVGVAYRAELGR